MAVTITTPKLKEKAVLPKVEVPQELDKVSLENLADLYGSLSDQAEALMTNPVFQNLKNVHAELLKRIAEQFKPEDKITISAEHYDLEVGAASKSPRKIEDKEAVFNFLGKDTFLSLCSIPVGDASKYLNGEQIEQVCSEPAYTNNRKVVSNYKG